MDLQRLKNRNRAFLILLLVGLICFLMIEWTIYVIQREQVEWVTVDAEVERMIEQQPSEAIVPDEVNLPPPTTKEQQEGADQKDAAGDDADGSITAEPKRVNINTATAAELESLNGIGPVKAREMVNYRDETGRLSALNK